MNGDEIISAYNMMNIIKSVTSMIKIFFLLKMAGCMEAEILI